MIWKKTTTINDLSANKLMKIIYEQLSINNQKIALCDMFDTHISKLKDNLRISGAIMTDNLDSLNSLLGVCDCKNHNDFVTHENMSKTCERLRQAFNSDYSMFITQEKNGQVGICVQSKIRTYVTMLEVAENAKKTIRYRALYELAKIIYNEANQGVPTKERKIIF